MHEILFHGQRVDNEEWVEGYYVCLNDHEHRIYTGCAETDCGDYYPDHFSVVPETVGQYTGLTDKNGKKIFEGDIVDVEYDIQYAGVAAERIGLFEVIFYDGCFMKKKRSGGLFYFILSDKCQVVGNIYDNPELLEDKQ